MPRIGRLVIPNYPHHVIHRGHNRQPIFVHADDYRFYLDNLAECKDELNCRLHAYCLMTNHVHLVIDPGGDPESLGRLMKKVAARQTRYVNRKEVRSGTLWEGRYRSSIICKETYLLACCRYVEMNPVRACMVSHPGAYRWSSYKEKTGEGSGIVDPDPSFLALAADELQRKQAYEKWVLSSIPEGEWGRIRVAVQRGHLTGTHRLEEEVAKRLGIRLEMRKPGRPRKIREK